MHGFRAEIGSALWTDTTVCWTERVQVLYDLNRVDAGPMASIEQRATPRYPGTSMDAVQMANFFTRRPP
jgi:hypothetical protein